MGHQNSFLSPLWEHDSKNGNGNFPSESPVQTLARFQHGQAIFTPADIGAPALPISAVISNDHTIHI